MNEFYEKLRYHWDQGRNVCIGLDPEFGKLPKSCVTPKDVRKSYLAFLTELVRATAPYACAFKPNTAFFEHEGSEGLSALRDCISYVHKHYPEIPVILDAKRGDIGNTNIGYAKAAFQMYGADAITLNPYMGGESLLPFLSYTEKGLLILCRTSNPGAGEFQDLMVEGRPLFQVVADRVANHWNLNGNCGLVVGATCPEELKAVREIAGDIPILVPGIGAQGGDLEAAVKAGRDSTGAGMIINSSRGIIYASAGEDFAEEASRVASRMNNLINLYRAA